MCSLSPSTCWGSIAKGEGAARLGPATAAHENKTEGLFLFRLQARSNVFVLWLCLRVGLKPYAETQRFVPKFVGNP